MSSDFDWRVETDPTWPRNEVSPEPGAVQTKSLWLKIGLLLMILSLCVAYFIAHNRANQVETAVHTDIIAAHDLIWQAAQRGDKELFNSLLLIKSQQQWQGPATFSHNPFNRPQLDLALQPQSSQIITVAVAPSLDTAQVIAEQQYKTAVGDPVSLHHTYIYQQQDDRWLLSAPDAAFWGELQQTETEQLVINYPARDAPLVQQLAADLNQLLNQLCQRPNISCQSVLPLNVNLNTAGPASSRMPLFRTAFLPTPSLLGVPVDESGYQPLFRYYGRHLADLLWQLLPGEGSGELMNNGRFAQAAWNQYLIEHNVRTWPPSNASSPPTWPDTTLAALCLNQEHTGLDWWHYQPQTAVWHKKQSLHAISSLLPLANGAFLLQQKSDQQTKWLLTWPEGKYQIIHDSAPNDAQIVPYSDGLQLRLLSRETDDVLLLDIPTCRSSACEWQIAPETVFVSPNGRQQLSQHGFHLIHDKGDESPPTTSPNAFAPFWLQDRFYGYLRPLPGSSADIQVFIRNTNNNETYPLFTTQDIRAQLPDHTETIIITAITPVPYNINQIMVEVYTPEYAQTTTFAFYRSTGILELLTTSRATSENRWLLALNDGLITLHPPEHTPNYTLVPPTPTCAYAAWLTP